MVIAISIVPSHTVLIWRIVPQIQVAIRMVIAVRLIVCCASEPPRRAVSCFPSPLGSIARVHRVLRAPSTAVGGACDVNDPMRSAELCG